MKQSKDFELASKHAKQLEAKYQTLLENHMQTKADHARMSRSLDKMKKKEILYDDAVNRQMQM